MKKRVIITTIVSFVLLLAVVLAALNAIFTVTSVRADFCTYSAEGRKEALELQQKLNSYVGKSNAFLDLKDLEKKVAEYPSFRVEHIAKRLPDQVEVTVRERKESFAYELADGRYAALDEDGAFLRVNPSPANRVSGENILLNGFGYTLNAQGGTDGRYFEELFSVFAEMRGVLGEVRANVVSATFYMGGGPNATETHYFRFAMREGVVIDLYNPKELAAEKGRAAIELYAGVGEYETKGLKDDEKTVGVITVNVVNGKVVPNYQPTVD